VTSFLLFTLHAPLASWGEIAVGEWRGSWDRPSRSAVLGLLGAALGLLRDDVTALAALADGYGVGVRNDSVGDTMQDYHTAQSVSRVEMRRSGARTRADMMAVADKQTILSRREYRQDVVFTVAVWQSGSARWQLGVLADALRFPVFALYAGRRSNPLGLPVHPVVVEASTLASALESRLPLPDNVPAEFRRLRPRQGWGREVAHDSCVGFESGLVEPFRRYIRRDSPVNRLGWLFEERVMHVGTMPISEAFS
jgi:CRISPR system Cascade subunit CasD